MSMKLNWCQQCHFMQIKSNCGQGCHHTPRYSIWGRGCQFHQGTQMGVRVAILCQGPQFRFRVAITCQGTQFGTKAVIICQGNQFVVRVSFDWLVVMGTWSSPKWSEKEEEEEIIMIYSVSRWNCHLSRSSGTLATHSEWSTVCLGEIAISLGRLVLLLLIQNDLQCVSVKPLSL